MGAPSRAKLALVRAAERGADTLVQRCDTGDMAVSWRFEHVAVGSCDDVITMPWGDVVVVLQYTFLQVRCDLCKGPRAE